MSLAVRILRVCTKCKFSNVIVINNVKQSHFSQVRAIRSFRASPPRTRRILSDLSPDADPSDDLKSDVVGTDLTSVNTKEDYEHFRKIANAVSKVNLDSTGGKVDVKSLYNDNDDSVTDTSENGLQNSLKEGYDLSGVVPALPTKSYNLAAYVTESETLSNLVKLGVDLSKVEKDVSTAEKVLKLNFESNIKPVLLLLHGLGVNDEDIGKCITKAPGILLEPLDNINVRLNYFESKKFPKESIARIVVNQPVLVLTSTKQIDTQLGYLQRDFMLTGLLYLSIFCLF